MECIHCHTKPSDFGGFEGGPSFVVAGTVYPTGHEPDLCNGVDGGVDHVAVVLTDANGVEFSIPVNGVGNFFATYADLPSGFTDPIHAKVVSDKGERVMVAALTSGDCNSCHTQDGANGAPGRIVAP
ncbi:MAG: hypothetical protein D6705_18730 [Deltaproteobacteria bacterium]|nr:MAG: hypothetical protein D6705_18730 [Deltaproteobacteria bacterium]